MLLTISVPSILRKTDLVESSDIVNMLKRTLIKW